MISPDFSAQAEQIVDGFFDVNPPRREASLRRTELKITIAKVLCITHEASVKKERERCAKVAEAQYPKGELDWDGSYCQEIAFDIATAIRQEPRDG